MRSGVTKSQSLIASQRLRISCAAPPEGSISVTPLPWATASKNLWLVPICWTKRGPAASSAAMLARMRRDALWALIEEEYEFLPQNIHSAPGHNGRPNIERRRSCRNNREISALDCGKRCRRFERRSV